MLLSLLLACAPNSATEPDDAPPGTPVDPDVATWWPDHVPVESASRVVFFGDSITAGFGINQSRNQYTNLLLENHDARWPTYSGNSLTERYGELEVFDFSRSGAETPELLQFQIPQMQNAFAGGVSGHTLVFMTIGGNDMVGAIATGGVPTIAATLDENIEEIAQAFQDEALFPDGATLFFTNIYEPSDGEGLADECFFGLDLSAVEPVLDEVNENSLALAMEYDFAWVDLRGHFRGHGHNFDAVDIEAYDADDPTLWLQDDCIHPTARGHHELRRLFLAAVDGEPLPLEIIGG